VVEVGSGQSPHPRADVVVDKYVVDDFERPHEAAIDVSKPLIVADGQALPFADRSFDYAIALHVLEHATDPERFAAELARVAPAGFVQVPSREAELTFGWPYHPWLIGRDGDTLVFEPRDGSQAPIGELFHDAYAESGLFRLWWSAYRSRWHHSVEWRNELRVEVARPSAAEATAALDVERTRAVLTRLADAGSLTNLPDGVRAALRCPEDAGALRDAPSGLECEVCGRMYPVVGQVPLLLAEAVA
jgi:SAM-dependent methyltransferase